MAGARLPFEPPGPEAKVFVISVAAELSGLHPQTLRTYDRLGLVSPGRVGGGARRYSLHDVALLRDVARLSAEGLGLEGIKRVLDLEQQVTALQEQVLALSDELALAHAALQQTPNLPVHVPHADAQMVLWRRPRRR
ncbi:heat shock protein transcriptional repressor HspR [Solicola sp. PLA-1-18]|uniref:heat shock protein transcriptional repressor HspR n=1 Tax=Solicola sp. PLA-1-18 TaxID=3380532 RepID=UPI003B7AEE13